MYSQTTSQIYSLDLLLLKVYSVEFIMDNILLPNLLIHIEFYNKYTIGYTNHQSTFHTCSRC